MTIELQNGTATKPSFKMTGGIYTLTTLELHSASSADIAKQLEDMTRKAPNFFQNTPVVIALDRLDHEQATIDLYKLRHNLQQYGLIMIAIRGGHEGHKNEAITAGIPWLPSTSQRIRETDSTEDIETNVVIMQKTRPSVSTAADIQSPTEIEMAHKTTLIEYPVRSGQQIYTEGDLVITSPVSAGAELLAGGSIHVYGPLRGRALAGINGNIDSRIFCLQFEAELISINGQYKMPAAPNSNDPFWGKGVIVSLDEQSLHIRAL